MPYPTAPRPLRGLMSGASRAAWAVLIALCCSTAAMAQVRYYYDELNRLIEMVAPDGSSVHYTYDANDNIKAMVRKAVSALSISEFTPNGGPAGTTVQIYGSGFVSTPGNNTVQFNGKAATVTAATATQLTVKVPSGATTGKIKVSNANGTASSASNFVVGAQPAAPTLTGFTPTVGRAGDVVTLTGTNFQLAPDANQVVFGQLPTTVVQDADSPSATQLKAPVPPGVPSGKISITTPYGKAISSADFYAVPPHVDPAKVQFTERLQIDGAPVTGTTTAVDQVGVFIFDAPAGARGLVVEIPATSMVGGKLWVYRPGGGVPESMPIEAGNRLVLLPLANAGTYTILIDHWSSAGSITVQLRQLDLAVSNLAIGAIVAQPDGSWKVAVTYTVSNVGSAIARPRWYDMGYLSADAHLDNADQRNSNSEFESHSDPLLPGASYQGSGFFKASPTTAAGTYTLFVKTDGHDTSIGGTNTDDGDWMESNEANNVAAATVTLSRPDLRISALTVDSTVANTDGSWTNTVSYTVTNVGGAAAQTPWQDKAYLSADAVLDDADLSQDSLAFRSGDPLAPGASYSVTNSFVAGSRANPPGTYTVFVKTDGHNAPHGTNTDTGELVEANEADNVASATVVLGRPDLRIDGTPVVQPMTVNQDGSWTIPVRYVVTNAGTVTAQPSWTDKAYLSADAVLDDADQSGDDRAAHWDALAPGATYNANIDFTSSASTAPGNYTLFVKADGRGTSSSGSNTYAGYLAETNESNNTKAVPVTLVQPDLRISGFTVGAISANSDGSWTIPLRYTVTNISSVALFGSWYEMAYLSTDATLDNSDVPDPWYLTDKTSIDAGGFYVIDVNFRTSTTTAPGSYTVFVKTDGRGSGATGGTNTDGGRVVEANEANNTASAPVTLSR